MPLKPKWKLTVAISKKASPAVNADLGENNKKAFGIIQGYLNMLDVPVVLFWKQDSLFGKWLYFVLVLSDTKLQSHRSAEETDREVILVSGFDKAERKLPVSVSNSACMMLSSSSLNRYYGSNSWDAAGGLGIGSTKREAGERWG